jgi:competence protein ComGC
MAAFTMTELLIIVGILGLLAAIVVPAFFKARSSAQRAACIGNLRQLEDAKQCYAMEKRLREGAKIQKKQITPYLHNLQMPTCPAGGKYVVQRLGRDPHCNLESEGHYLRWLYPDPDSE